MESLDHALKHLSSSQDARHFVETYAGPVIGILAEQSPSKIGHHEHTCVQDSLALACLIVAKDLEIQLARKGECLLLEAVLSHAFSKKKNFYKGTKGVWQQAVNPVAGFPEVRIRNIEKFRAASGFHLLYAYLFELVQNKSLVEGAFPALETVHHILTALQDTLPTISTTDAAVAKVQEDDAIQISKAVMLHLSTLTDDALKKMPTELLSVTVKALQKIFDRLVSTRRDATVEFYAFWRGLVLSMITSQSLPLKLTGWEQVNELIKAVAEHRPPPRSFMVSNAGCPLVNGEYIFAGQVTADGYAKPGADVSYVRAIPADQPEGGGKRLTLFRCTMRSQQKWWFLSEADEEQPGTDRDIDYYQHKSKEHEEAFPPPGGWITCRSAGVQPPPVLQAVGLMVPPGQELETLEHQLAKWAIENEIVEQVLGNTTIHREVVTRSTVLIKFLASMCTRDKEVDVMEVDSPDEAKRPNKYCLQTSHLLYAWKTCTRKADAAVSLQVYQLLVSILPLCPSNRAIPLLQAIQTSLNESSEKRDYLFEVSEFCSALAALNLVEVSSNNKAAAVPGTALTEDVREEVLNLLWSVLTHPGVSSLKSYDSLKRYVTRELKVEPKGSEHRERFLRFCITVLSANAEKISGSTVDEVQALRMVKLTRFILEACPRLQADTIVMTNNGALPMLLFAELVSYLERRRERINRRNGQTPKPPLINSCGVSIAGAPDANENSISALEERLRVLRYVYGLSDFAPGTSDPITMTSSMLNTLWTLCQNVSEDREVLMVFIASASHPCKATQYERFGVAVSTTNSPGVQAEPLLSAAFTEDVCQSVFVHLFCSLSFNYDLLGNEGYRSFQFLFKGLRESSCPPGSKKIALDALWKVCLTAGKDSVATQAMKDLLAVYVGTMGRSIENGQNGEASTYMVLDEINKGFGDRMFQCLERVKIDLEAGVPSAERSVERCMRILNAAIGRVESEGLTTTPTLARLLVLSGTNCTLNDAVKRIPHGMRGRACCRRIGIIAKRPQSQNQNANNYDGSSLRLQPTVKFSLDVHPLETLSSIKYKVALNCQCTVSSVKLIQINGRARGSINDQAHMSLNVVPEDYVMDELGVVQGCEIVFVIAERAMQSNTAGPVATAQRSVFSHDLSAIFFSDDCKFADRLFSVVLSILEALPWKEPEEMSEADSCASQSTDINKLVWDLLLAMPINESVAAQVKSTHGHFTDSRSTSSADDAMDVESSGESWLQLLDSRSFDRSVYVLLTIDAFLQPAPEALSIFPADKRLSLENKMVDDANDFRRAFVDAGGFGAVVQFFSVCGGDEKTKQVITRRGNAVALRILKSCLFGNIRESQEAIDTSAKLPDEAGIQLLRSLSDSGGLLKSLTAMVVEDRGISSSTVTDVLRFLRLLFQSDAAAETFLSLPDAEKFLAILLMWDEGTVSVRLSSSISAAIHVRKGAHDLILGTPALADNVLSWLINAIEGVDVNSESTSEYFDVLEKLVSDKRSTSRSKNATDMELRGLANTVCKKLATCPRPGNETDLNDVSTGVLCGCMKILRALIEHGDGNLLRSGANILLTDLDIDRWSERGKTPSQGVLSLVSKPFSPRMQAEDVALVDLIGAIFDGFVSPGGSSSVAICFDKESRGRGFDVIGSAARACKGTDGYMAIAERIDILIISAAPKLRHRWGQFGASSEPHSRNRVSKYSGLRNQGCTCYMNSVLQQLFMMSELRQSMCSAQLPATLRSVGSKVSAKGAELVGKKVSLQWEAGGSFDAMVESFDDNTDMHTIRYCPIQIAVGAAGHQQVHPDDFARMPPSFPDEFLLSEGRPGKETGVFEVVPESTDLESAKANDAETSSENAITETEDESLSRHLLEEVQRTFIHLEEGSRGHCFDPRALVEACACLKLEFDVWQQNDASEFATKLLDRLEISLKKWAPTNFQHMDHTFGLKQTKQKICKKCGLKSNREEKLLNIDCQIRGKSDIHEALSAMTEVEIMEGSNQVYCDGCKENTDTILKSAISTLPNMLILSLKRFDLDYNTFETVKLNSRCAFGQTLNMKKYTLDAVEVIELAEKDKSKKGGDFNSMETEDSQVMVDGDDLLSSLPDEDYEYRLVGVLVHAGVAQGGHYYSFIKDRITGSDEKWYRFDDEDVTPFDPASIETECFGGKMKKETKWPNGQVHTVEQEQFANALMLFYEKVRPNDFPSIENSSKEADFKSHSLAEVTTMSGYDVFEPDVRRSNETHQWQSFLFDNEFQAFLKGMLRFCRLSKGDRAAMQMSDDSWRATVIQMLLSFLFDVMLYSSDCSSVNEWSRILEEILLEDSEIAIAFLRKLSKKTSQVSANWLRTYIMDCPDHSLRAATLRIFIAAIMSCSASEDEMKALTAWMRGWREQLAELQAATGDKSFAIPCDLKGKWSALEDTTKIGAGASSLGIILSFINAMLEALPRCWRFSSELCLLIRFLASSCLDKGDLFLRRPMTDAQIPARLIALIARDRAPIFLRIAFPGASLSTEVANTQMRPESNHNAHMMPMSGNQALSASDLNSPRGPGHSDYVALLEALTCLAGIPGTLYAPLVERETEDIGRGRQWFSLTEVATKALSSIFDESCSPGAPGMGQREIETYLQRCGVDTSGALQQKILDMLSKYPTTGGTETERYLSLDGFIAYYRDCVQSNDLRLRLDLHTFGYRPNLTRRSHEARFFKIGDRDSLCPPVQSVAIDVAEMFKDRSLELGQLANFALAHTAYLYSVAHEVYAPLMEYLVAGVTYRKNSEMFIDRTLMNIYLSRNDWEGNKAVGVYSTMLQVIASTPGDDQQLRINRIMTTGAKATRTIEFGSGVLNVLRALHQMRQGHSYSNEVHWSFSRFMHLLKDLHALYPVYKWMSENRNLWSFVERELLDSSRAVAPHQNLVRAEYGPREQETAISLEHNTNSDSDMGGMHDSEDEDEDSQFDTLDLGGSISDGPSHISVEGAGNPAVNGIYMQDGFFEAAIRYVMDGNWKNNRYKFYIFLCNVSNNTKHWYISIVPYGGNPGTSSDIDFYTAQMTEKSTIVPPKTGWMKTGEGSDPAPRLVHRDQYDDQDVPERVVNGTIIEQETNEDRNPQHPYL